MALRLILDDNVSSEMHKERSERISIYMVKLKD